jgi:hypothetical protein
MKKKRGGHSYRLDLIKWDSVEMTRQAVKEAPLYDSTKSLNREQEIGLFHHYGRTGYWPAPAAKRPLRSKATRVAVQ